MWDCVATCFFIDTAHNVLDYIETIWNILKPGGVWINLGKLQILHNHFQSNVICKWKAENTHVVESVLYLISKVHFFTIMRIWPMNCPLSWAMMK